MGFPHFLPSSRNRTKPATVIKLDAKTKSITTSAGPTQFAQDLTIEGLEHRLTLSAGHAVTYFTSPTTIVYELILDDLVYGTLDEENVLG